MPFLNSGNALGRVFIRAEGDVGGQQNKVR